MVGITQQPYMVALRHWLCIIEVVTLVAADLCGHPGRAVTKNALLLPKIKIGKYAYRYKIGAPDF